METCKCTFLGGKQHVRVERPLSFDVKDSGKRKIASKCVKKKARKQSAT